MLETLFKNSLFKNVTNVLNLVKKIFLLKIVGFEDGIE